MNGSSAIDENGGGRELTRRGLLAAGGAAAAGSALAGPLAVAQAAAGVEEGSDPFGPSINGTLRAVEGDALVLEGCHLSFNWQSAGLPDPGSDEVAVKTDGNTLLFRDSAAKLSDFQPGDQLAAYVRWDGEELVASSVQPVYVGVEGGVSDRGDDWLRVGDQVVVLTDSTIVRGLSGQRSYVLGEASASTRAATVASLARVAAMCRFDRASGKYIAANVAEPS